MNIYEILYRTVVPFWQLANNSFIKLEKTLKNKQIYKNK